MPADGDCARGVDAVLRYDEPVNEWEYRLLGTPLGNGRLGAMFTGGPTRDAILLNHDCLQTVNEPPPRQRADHLLPELRSLCAASRWDEAQRLLGQMVDLAGGDRHLGTHHPVGDLFLELDLPGPAEEYERTLDLRTGVGRVTFRAAGVRYRRTIFVSGPDQALVLHVAADRPASIDGELALGRAELPGCELVCAASPDGLEMKGAYPDGLAFQVRGRIERSGGEAATAVAGYRGAGGRCEGGVSEKLVSTRICGADEVLLALAIGVDHPQLTADGLPPHLPDPDTSFHALLEGQERHHAAPMERVALSLAGSSTPADAVADRLLHDAYRGRPSARLFELAFQMGRYTLMACSRPGSRAMNLQGIWNHLYQPPWHCRYQVDVNVQMDYWPANPAGLPDCNLPLFDLLDDLAPLGRAYARDLYGCRGILLGVATDQVDVRYRGNYAAQCCAGWLAQHYWTHYEYTLDEEFLRARAYPFMRQVGEFLEDFLVSGDDGRLHIVPGNSPENAPGNRADPATRICRDATVDVAVAREVLESLARASQVLGIDGDRRDRWRDMAGRLPDWPVDADGVLKEWCGPDDEERHAHRHLSHLYPLFPGADFTPEKTPALVAAALRSLELRRQHARGDATHFSYVCPALVYARAGEGDAAYRCLCLLLKGFYMDNMLTSMGDWRQQGLGRRRQTGRASHILQAEAGPATAAAVAEMLLQSHGGLIRILPALPSAWPDGQVKGLCARGAMEVDIHWRGSQIEQVRILSRKGARCRVRFCRPVAGPIRAADGSGRPVAADFEESGTLAFDTEPGGQYVLRPGRACGRGRPERS